ncbi:MAG: hypothetical protein JO005_06175 [Gammaproteobacteria bacterium]|nr:hypothetical protein [Gammaproteobacteria bacterium]
MNLSALRAARLAAWLSAAGAVAASGQLSAAATLPAVSGGEVYQDRYIAGGTLAPDISAGDSTNTTDPAGLARSIRIDALLSALESDGANAAPPVHENGALLQGQWDTTSYGAWSADAAVRAGGAGLDRAGNEPARTSFSVHERGLAFDGGWQANNALGDISQPLVTLARSQPRFFLAQGPMEGIATEWLGPSAAQFVGGIGEPGIYEGIRVPTFAPIGGSTATLGGQWSPATPWLVGGELATARNVALYDQPVGVFFAGAPAPRISTTTGLIAAAWQSEGSRLQFNILDGTMDGNGNALGVWMDAARTQGAFTQSAGLFRIEPNLAWGNQVIASDAQGGYYRVDYQSRRWLADFGIDQVRPVSGFGSDTTFLNGSARYQVSRDTGVGGVLDLRRSDRDRAWSAEAYFDSTNSLGVGRGQVDYATDPQTRDTTLTMQQTWNMRAGARLSTTAALDWVRGSSPASVDPASTLLRLAIYGGGDLSARLSIDGSLQWAAAVQGRAVPARSADISLTWQLTRGWSVLGSYYENRAGSWSPLVINSPLTPVSAPVVPAAGVRGFFLTVRYQETRGAHFVPLGGTPGGGSGHLSGTVYLDANENGRYDAGEAGAANVTVILDGRFSVHTDASGRFEFPLVASGHHVLTVQPDNLPLPWCLTNAGRAEAEVGTRGSAEVNIGAVRLKCAVRSS